MRFILPLFLALALLPGVVGGQQTSTARTSAPAVGGPVRSLRAERRSGPIVIDGRLDDAAWAAATPTGDFTQSYPAPGARAPDRTEVRVLYDDVALYVGIRMFDAHPDSIAAGLAGRDATSATGIYSDWVHLIIDSYHDRRTAFRFSTTPRAVQKDVYTYDDGSEDLNWDAIWEVGTRVDSLGWTAEYRIPLSQLRFGGDSAAGRVWGFQVQRDIARRNERDSWSPWTPQDGGFVSRFGELTGLTGVRVAERLEVTPYASSTVTRGPGNAANPFYSPTDTKPKLGGDVKYGLPGGLTLSATINPDFGQVEVDPAVVNLSAFETSFPEKRPFFLEGSDVFGFGQVVRHNDYGGNTFLYSRRIGRQPQRAVPRETQFADVPTQTTIAGAAKVTGKSGPWTVGLLDAVTTEQRARLLLNDGTRLDTPVEPLTNYFAGRVKRDFRGGATTVGAMLERTSRALGDSAFGPLLRSEATFGGLDFEHDMAQRSWIVSGFAAASRVQGSAQAIARTEASSAHYFQRPDATDYLTYDTTRTSLGGYIAELALSKQGANFGSIAVKASSPGLEINDLGRQTRTGYKSLSTLVGHQDFKAGRLFQSWTAYAYENDSWDYGGIDIFHAYAGQVSATRNDLSGGFLGAGYSPDFYDNVLLRGGPLGRQPSSWYLRAGVNSDSRRPVVLNLSGGYTRDVIGGDLPEASISVDLRPSSNVHVNFGPSFSRLHDRQQLVRSVADPLASATYGRRYVFADLTQSTLSLDTRIDVTLSPTLSVVMYAQPFVSTGRYEGFKELLAPGRYDFAVYGVDRDSISYDAAAAQYTVTPRNGATPAFTIDQPNFNVRSLRGNAVVRWDYRPGSSLFVVWQQQRSAFEPIGDFDTRRDVGAIFRTVPTDVFLVKATYWIGR